jgi:hypothetical protein
VHCQEPIALFGYRDCTTTSAIQKGLWKDSAHKTFLPTIRHYISTLGGNSGSPLLVRRNGATVAVAIHKGGRKAEEYNGARAITQDLLANLLVWEKEMASDIRFCLMTSSKDTASKAQPEEWLTSASLKIEVLLSDLKSSK